MCIRTHAASRLFSLSMELFFVLAFASRLFAPKMFSTMYLPHLLSFQSNLASARAGGTARYAKRLTYYAHHQRCLQDAPEWYPLSYSVPYDSGEKCLDSGRKSVAVRVHTCAVDESLTCFADYTGGAAQQHSLHSVARSDGLVWVD